MSVRNTRRPFSVKATAPTIVTRVNSQPTQLAEKQKYRAVAYQAFNRLKSQKDHTKLDWMHIHVRLSLGVIAMATYFNHDEEVADTFNMALRSLHIAWVRFAQTDVLGLTVLEQRCIVDAFDIVDVLFHELNLYEIKALNKIVSGMYDQIEKVNKVAETAPKNGANERMLQELAAKYQRANEKKVA